MYRTANPMFLICESPTHVGSGSDVGIIDLPIQRERHTDYPKFEASSIKGSIREAFERKFPAPNQINDDLSSDLQSEWVKIHRVFGYDSNNKALERSLKKVKVQNAENNTGTLSFAGSLGFSDARILFFPVKSMKGVFAWVTCPSALSTFYKEAKMASISNLKELQSLKEVDVEPTNAITMPSTRLGIAEKIVLEEFTFSLQEEVGLEESFTWLANQLFSEEDPRRAKFARDVVILHDDDFKDFVNLSTEVITRTKINNQTGTVEKGGLFTIEYLPTETILYSLALTAPEFTETQNGLKEEDVFNFLTQLPDYFQIGADATLGKGIVRHKILRGGIS
ncbi:MAG: type III-B CRISPR module RAMP protein Cmr4 [Rhodothermia bacterium]|nr:type III-B CRISPR module RAMP protein Cmr4 [Rhodothermia bacterium]